MVARPTQKRDVPGSIPGREGGWSGGAMALGKLPVPGRPTIWIRVGQGPTALVVGAGGVVWTFLLSSILFSSLSPSLWETARYRLKYCLTGPLNPKQPTNQSIPGPATDSRRVIVSYWRMYVRKVLVNRLGGLCLPRKMW